MKNWHLKPKKKIEVSKRKKNEKIMKKNQSIFWNNIIISNKKNKLNLTNLVNENKNKYKRKYLKKIAKTKKRKIIVEYKPLFSQKITET